MVQEPQPPIGWGSRLVVKRRRQFLIASVLLITGICLLCFVIASTTRRPHYELKFVKHGTCGVTHVVVFRLKWARHKGELTGPGKIVSGTAQFDARWMTNFSSKLPVKGEKEFAVIAPYDRAPWRLQLTFVRKPSDVLVKLRRSWFLLKTRRTAALPELKAVWGNTTRLPLTSWRFMVAGPQFDKPVWQETVESDLVTNTVAKRPE